MLEGAGIDQSQLERPGSRFPYSAIVAVRLEVCRLLDDESAGFLDQPARWGSTVYFCRAIVSSRTLREAFYRYERFSAILNDEVQVRVVEGPEHTAMEFHFENRKGIDIKAEAENRIFFLLSFSLWLTDKKFLPSRIGFAFPRPGYAGDYSQIVPCSYEFDQPINRLVLANARLREPVRRSPRLLNQFLSGHLYYLIREMITASSIVQRVRRLVEVGVGVNTDLDAIAAALDTPPTTLRRRLKAEGCSFQEIKDEVRRARAIHYLVDRRLTVAETAGLTGFSDAAAFSRAFKTWTGRNPSAYGHDTAFPEDELAGVGSVVQG